MTIKQTGGIFGRNPSFNEVDANQVGIGLDDPQGALHVKLGTGYSAGNTWNTGSAVFGGEAATDGALGLTYNNTDGSILASIIPLVAWKPVKVHASQFSVLVNGSTNVATVDGDGLKFNGDTAAANALDDYEEGTWTPVVADASSGGNTGTASTAAGEYTKVGNLVYAKCNLSNINTSGLTAGNDFYIQGLPYTAANTASFSMNIGGCSTSGGVAFNGTINPFVGDNEASIRFLELAASTNLDYLLVSEISSGTADIWLSVTYQAA